MDERQDARTRAEAGEHGIRRSGANRNRFWAGLNRHPVTESERERKAGKTQSGAGRGTPGPPE